MAPAGGVVVRELTVAATDGHLLAATEFLPAGDPRRAAIIAPATGVPRRYYAAYARYLASRGVAVLSWDWRGIGGSSPPSLRGFRATMRDWAVRDLGGALAATAERFPHLPLVAVAHSFGGQAIGLAPGRDRIVRMVTVAAPSGYWGHYRRPWRYALALLWYGLLPATTRTLGYFPARRLGMGENLPAGVALEWARWCRSPEYLGDWGGHGEMKAPILALSFTDDVYAPPAATDALHDHYVNATQTRRYIAPRDVGLKAIGHFGFFREGRVPELWSETADFLSRP